MQVGLFDAQHNLPSYSHAVEEVVDEPNIVYEGVNVTGAQHQQSGDQLNVMRGEEVFIFGQGEDRRHTSRCVFVRLTVNSKAGMGVQRVM